VSNDFRRGNQGIRVLEIEIRINRDKAGRDESYLIGRDLLSDSQILNERSDRGRELASLRAARKQE